MPFSLSRFRADFVARTTLSSAVALSLSGCLFYGNELCDPGTDPAGCLGTGGRSNPTASGGAGPVPGAGGRGANGGTGGVDLTGGSNGSGGDGAGGVMSTGGSGTGGMVSTGGNGSGGDGGEETGVRRLHVNEMLDGDYSWVELYNPSSEPVSLANVSVSAGADATSVDWTNACSLNSAGEIQAGGYVVAFAGPTCWSGIECVPGCTFRLNAGQRAFVVYEGAVVVESVPFPQPLSAHDPDFGESYQSYPDGSTTYEAFMDTPGAENVKL